MRTAIDERTLLVSVGYRARPTLAVELGVGAVLDGTLRAGGSPAVDVQPGAAGTLGVSWLAVLETASRPFVALSAGAGVSSARTVTARVTAVDFRGSLVAGKTFLDRLTVYASARLFGGPVFWRLGDADVVGSDVHHYALGGGARLILPGSLDLFVEGMAAGEQSVSTGLGWSF